ncbi:MAG: SUMF1/EgtB/PvdO family nonheme iron enzyme [Anaerolineae bacterium]
MGQYNRLGKRRASGAWQWLVIGFFPGILCGGLVVFLMLFFTFDGFNSEPDVIEVTAPPVQIVEVVTATPDPEATAEVQIITATPEPTEAIIDGEIEQPTLTPFSAESTEVEINSASADTETEEPTAAVLTNPNTQDNTDTQPDTSAQGQSAPSNAPNIPAELAGIASNLVRVEGDVFQYGADQLEIIQAANDCQTRDGGQCQPSFGDDSTPRVAVELDTFWIEQNEVTFEQYATFLNYQNSQGLRHTGGCQGFLCIQTQNERPEAAVIAFDGANYRIPENYSTLRNHPVYGVTWYGAQTYCEAMGRRLPTEAEWEYAARAGGQDIVYPWGNNWAPTNANVRLPLVEGTGNATVPITDLATGTNALGLTHMAGNVAEWVQDYYSETYYLTLSNQQQSSGEPVQNPTGPAGGTQRVLRGGSFNALPFFARTVHRQSDFPAPEVNNGTYPLWVGFRCASDTSAEDTLSPSEIEPSSLQPTIPTTGGEADNNAQPEAPIDTENESSSGDDNRG